MYSSSKVKQTDRARPFNLMQTKKRTTPHKCWRTVCLSVFIYFQSDYPFFFFFSSSASPHTNFFLAYCNSYTSDYCNPFKHLGFCTTKVRMKIEGWKLLCFFGGCDMRGFTDTHKPVDAYLEDQCCLVFPRCEVLPCGGFFLFHDTMALHWDNRSHALKEKNTPF